MIDLPRVSDIIKFSGTEPPYPEGGNHRELGTAVDMGCRWLFKGYKVDDLEPLDPLVKPYLISLELWLAYSRFRAKGIQEKLTDEHLGYYGHPDVFDEEWTLDTKTGGKSKAYRLQTAGYQHLTKSKRRGCLYLSPDGPIAKLDEHTDRGDWGAFLSALKLMQGEKAMEPYRQNLKNWLESA